MSKAFLLFIGIIALSVAQDYTVFRQIDQDEFGRTLIDTLQMEMLTKTEEPMLRFIDVMRDLETRIEEEQAEEDKKNSLYQSKCTTDLAEMEKDNAVLQRRQVETQSVIDELKPQKSIKESTLVAKNLWKGELEAKIDSLTKYREAEADAFQKKIQEIEYGIFVIQTVKRMFTQNQGSFLQTEEKDVLKQVQEQLNMASEEANKFTHKKSLAQTFKVLSQIASKMDQVNTNSPLVQRIVGLCDILLQNLESGRILEQRAEQKRINNFNREKGLYSKDLNGINTDISRLNASITQLDDQITSAQLDLDDTNKRLGNKSSQIDDRKKDCKEAAYSYELDRKKREEKRQIVSQIIGIIAGNQRDFQSYVKLRAQAGDYDGQNFKILGKPEVD